MHFHTVCWIRDVTHVGEARRTAVRLAESVAMTESQVGSVAIVVTELANNIVRYAKTGQLWMRAASDIGCELLAVDSGPGFDVERCLQDGYSTGGSPGNGLGAVRRLSSEFDIYSSADKGTVILSRIPLRKSDRAEEPSFEWGAISLCAPGETVCGDDWSLDIQQGQLRVVVADGLGHGPEASEAASQAIEVFQKSPSTSPKEFLEKANGALSGTRGAAVAAGQLLPSGDQFLYAGVGNISGTLMSRVSGRGLMSHNGIVGGQMRKLQQLDYQWPPGELLVLHSDGLQSRWDANAYAGLYSSHAAVVAGVLARDFIRGRDDVTIVVIRRL